MLTWRLYLFYLTCLGTGLLSLRMFWEGGLLTVVSGVAALSAAIWAAWYIGFLRRQPRWSVVIKDLVISCIWVGVGALGAMQRLVLRTEHGPALDSFESGLLIFLLILSILMAVLCSILLRSQRIKNRVGRA